MFKRPIRKKSTETKPIKVKSVESKSVTRLLKLNFLPIIFITYTVVMILLVFLLMGGGAEESGASSETGGSDSGTTGNSITMTAEELANDMDLQTDWSTYMTMDFKSLKEGNTLIIEDTISEINYDRTVDATKITFRYSIEGGGTGSSDFWFEEDITGTYSASNKVKITVTIKHVAFNFESFDYDMEVWTESWGGVDYFASHVSTSTQGFKPMSQSVISLA